MRGDSVTALVYSIPVARASAAFLSFMLVLEFKEEE